MIIIASGVAYFAVSKFGIPTAKPDPAPKPKYELPQDWHIVYRTDDKNIPDSIVYLRSNEMMFRFAIDFRTNLIGVTRAVKQP